MTNDVIKWTSIPIFLTILTASHTLTIPQHCDRFLQCELRMMDIHRKCTNNSRSEVAEACELTQDFDELSRLMLARVNEFSDCVESKAQDESLEYVEIDEVSCQASNNEQASPRTCWEAVARAKQDCQRLQSCCPAVKPCLKSGKTSPLTRALREKHSIINGRTSECRNDMRLVLRRPHRQDDPLAAKARAVLTAQGEKIIENIIQEEQELVKFNQPDEIKRLETTKIKMPLQDDMRVKMQALVKQLSKIILSDGTKPEDEQHVTEAPEIEETTTEEPTTEVPIFFPKIFVKKQKKQYKQSKEPILKSDIVRNLVTQRPHFSFALPPTVNLTKLNVFAARPELLHNSTNPPQTHRKIFIHQKLDDKSASVQADAFSIRRPQPPKSPPTFKVDSAAKSEMASRMVIEKELISFQTTESPFIDAETENEVDRAKRRKSKIFAANNLNSSTIQLHLVNHMRHKQRGESKETTTEAPIIEIITTPSIEMSEVAQITTTQMPETTIPQVDIIGTKPEGAMDDEDVRLIKLLRQMRLKPEDTQMRIRVKNTRVFDNKENQQMETSNIHPPSNERKIHIFTNTKPVLPEKVVMIDASTEFIGEDAATNKPMPKNRPLQLIKLKTRAFSKSKTNVPPVDADANKPLFGYRNKLLSIRRRGDIDENVELIPATKAEHIRDDESQQPQKHNGGIDDQLERTTIAYAPNRILSVNLADVLVPINWKEVRRAPQKALVPMPVIEQIDEDAELLQVKMDLIRNLEEYLEKHDFEKRHQFREQILLEEKRLSFLRRSRAEFERLDKKTGYCELYNVCTNQLKFVQNQCQNQTNQETTKFFKTKFGSCNARLWKQYQETDQIRLELLEIFEDCIIEEIALGVAQTLDSCPKDWPTLPFFDDQTECQKKTSLIHEHCTSLGRCCSSLKVCKEVAGKHDLFQSLSTSKQNLNKNAQKCKMTTSMHPSNKTESTTETVVPQTSRLI